MYFQSLQPYVTENVRQDPLLHLLFITRTHCNTNEYLSYKCPAFIYKCSVHVCELQNNRVSTNILRGLKIPNVGIASNVNCKVMKTRTAKQKLTMTSTLRNTQQPNTTYVVRHYTQGIIKLQLLQLLVISVRTR